MKNCVIFLACLVAVSALAEPEYPAADTPMNALRRYYLSLQHGDKATFSTGIHASDEQIEAISGMLEMGRIIREFCQEVEKLSPEDKTIGTLHGAVLGYSDFFKKVDGMKVEVTDDTAVVTGGPGDVPIQMKKVGDVWKLDMTEMEDQMAPAVLKCIMSTALPQIQAYGNNMLALVREGKITGKEACSSVPRKVATTMQSARAECIRQAKRPAKAK